MNSLFVPLSSKKGRVATLQKVIDDGTKMYQQSRYVIVLNKEGKVAECFQNIQCHGLLDCMVILAPCIYKGVFVTHAVALEIGFRRFVPYKQTEYRFPLSQTTYKVCAVKERIPVISLHEDLVLDLIPAITKGIQSCVNEIIGTWQNSTPIQVRENKNGEQYTHIASIFVRIPKTEHLLCAAARFKETQFRLSKTGPLAILAKRIKSLCKRFISSNARSKTEQGDYLTSAIKKSHTVWLIKETLNKRIQYRGFTEQMIGRMFTLVGKSNSVERKLLDQIFRVHKTRKPTKDIELDLLEKKFCALRRKLLSIWKITTFVSMRHAKKRKLHGSECLTMSALGSHKELVQMIKDRDSRRMLEYTIKEEEDADIPF